MARKGNHRKNGVDRQTKPNKKTSDSVTSTDGQDKVNEANSFPRQKLLNAGLPNGPIHHFLEKDADGENYDTIPRMDKHVMDQPVFSESNLAEDMPYSEPSVTTNENGIPSGSDFVPRQIRGILSSVLDTLRTNSPSENIELAYNAALRKLRISTATISREVTQWMERQRPLIFSLKSSVCRARDHVRTKAQQVYPIVFKWLMHFGSLILLLSLLWLDCTIRGIDSFLRMGTTSFFVIVWCSMFSVFAMVGITKFMVILAFTALLLLFLGFTICIIALALSGLVLLWLYGSFWTTLLVILFGGVAFMLRCERIALFILTVYSVYGAWVYVRWLGLAFAFNLAFISTDALIYFLKNNLNQQSGDGGPTEPINAPPFENGPGFSGDRGPGVASTSGTDSELTSEDEVARLVNCTDHYSALGLLRYEKVDVSYLKREYRKKAMLVHPDKNMGNEKAAEAFKKLQNAYEVLLDSVKRKSYDDELRREELLNCFRRFQNTSEKNRENRQQGFFGSGCGLSEGDREEPFRESRQIVCKRCGNLHVWFLTNKSKSRARWCQDCKDFHQAKDGDGWIEQSSQPIFFGMFHKVDTPCAYVCADSKIYDASQWYICQGMRCPANTHKPSFHVNASMTSKHHHPGGRGTSSGQRSNRVPNANMDETMNEEEFYEWLQNAVQAGMFDNINEHPSPRTGNGSGNGTSGSSSSNTKKKKKGRR